MQNKDWLAFLIDWNVKPKRNSPEVFTLTCFLIIVYIAVCSASVAVEIANHCLRGEAGGGGWWQYLKVDFW